MDYRVIKENDLFLLTDLSGDVTASGKGHGLYTKDTRFLSRLELKVNGEKPDPLVSEADENYAMSIILTNRASERDGVMLLWPQALELKRTRFIHRGVLYETIIVTNMHPQPSTFELSIALDADFRDMFIIRGFQNGKVGVRCGMNRLEQGLELAYQGVDGLSRKLVIEWASQPTEVREDGSGAEFIYRLSLAAGEASCIELFLTPVIGGQKAARHETQAALQELKSSYARWEQESTSVESDLPLFNRLYKRGLQDIRVLLTDLGFGSFPVAGLPWFAVPFGRDSLIAALQMLPVNPEVARGTIRTMAHYQGTRVDPWLDEQPGKIMHELREGELANSGQIPFTPYYGSIDATPLFLVLLAEYVKWSDDCAIIDEMVPHIRRALEWIDRYGDRTGSGFVAYCSESSKGISNQGWKDSGNSVVHRSGDFAEPPIALVEVQGYVYQAKTSLAMIFRKLGSGDWTAWAEQLEAEAEELRQRFERSYWLEQERYYALALDKDGQPVETVTSNPGHVLMSGMIDGERAEAVARRLVSPALFSGYGIRTMAEGEKAYNPMSYHNGSIWPHDNALCLMGLNALGYHEEAKIVIEGLLKASEWFENYRLPELFCGHSAERGKPVRYPVACSPQAWAAATPLVFVPAMMGLRFDYPSRRLALHPTLPEGMNELTVRRMRLGKGTLDVRVVRQNGSFEYEVLSNTTGWSIG